VVLRTMVMLLANVSMTEPGKAEVYSASVNNRLCFSSDSRPLARYAAAAHASLYTSA
jgi:hypothetical protein